jgi:hypothetical protein
LGALMACVSSKRVSWTMSTSSITPNLVQNFLYEIPPLLLRCITYNTATARIRRLNDLPLEWQQTSRIRNRTILRKHANQHLQAPEVSPFKSHIYLNNSPSPPMRCMERKSGIRSIKIANCRAGEEAQRSKSTPAVEEGQIAPGWH